jgi:hypothetical protein
VVGFSATPLILGLIAILASVVGVRRRIVTIGLVLAGWGAVVIPVAEGVVPAERTAPAYLTWREVRASAPGGSAGGEG